MRSTEQVSLFLDWRARIHARIVVSDEQNHELTDVTYVCSIIMQSISERQVRQVVADKQKAESNYDQRGQRVLRLNRSIVAQGKPISQRNDKVRLTK